MTKEVKTMKVGESLTLEHIKAARKVLEQPKEQNPEVITDREWEDIKSQLNVTDDQMEKLFVKATYIPMGLP